jgi:hypothetical protein
MKRFITLALLALTSVFVGAPAAHADDFKCVGFVGPITVDNVVVPSGTECVLDGTQVLGSVKTEPGAALSLAEADVHGNVEVKAGSISGAGQSTVGGNYQCDGCLSVIVFESEVRGSLQITGADDRSFLIDSVVHGNVEIVESSPGDFAFIVEGNNIGGNVKVEKNVGPTTVSENSIGGNIQIFENNVAGGFGAEANGHFNENQVDGNMQIFKNRGPSFVQINMVEENLQCKENVPPPVGEGNVANQKEDQCAVL